MKHAKTVKSVYKIYELSINRNERKVMVDRSNKNKKKNKEVCRFEVVDNFIRLGSMLINNGSCLMYIKPN